MHKQTNTQTNSHARAHTQIHHNSNTPQTNTGKHVRRKYYINDDQTMII